MKLLFNNVYENKRVLVTGHTGFKGSWLVQWLELLGSQVKGISLLPHTNPNHFELLNFKPDTEYIDIRNYNTLKKSIDDFKPEIIFHLAAKAIVADSYSNPLETITTNVVGSSNLLEIARLSSYVRAFIMITTDKVYKNKEWNWPYRENDELGGYDIYASSKSAVELLTQSFRDSLFINNRCLIAIARAGNVIGGGDWNNFRLIPDIVKSIISNNTFFVRNPKAVRPWQHVLEPLSGYLMLGQKLLGKKDDFASDWNFGPAEDNVRSVNEIISYFNKNWQKIDIQKSDIEFKETNILKLDSSKAKTILKWKPIWNFNETLSETINWYREYYINSLVITKTQIYQYAEKAKAKNLSWAQ